VSDELGALRAKVEEMRRLGVRKWGDIELDAPPPPPKREVTTEEELKRFHREQQRHMDVLFAASPAKPRLRKVTT
jgi:hypothetical protein